MGKKLRHKDACSPIQNHPGFIWGLFNILKHNHWRYIKKRLPHKRLNGRRHGARSHGNNARASSNDDLQAQNNTEVNSSEVEDQLRKPNTKERSKKPTSEEKSKKHNSEEKTNKHKSETKISVKARIKALITEDKPKKKGRHHRSSTYPVQSNFTEDDALHHLESSEQNSSNDECSRVFNQNANTSPTFGSLNPLFLMSEESNSSESDENDALNNQINGHGKKSTQNGKFIEKDEKKENNTSFDPKSIHAKELGENDDVSPRRSKAFLDALNLINMNKEFLLKVLQDPDSPLARHFHSHQALSVKMVLTKTESFRAPGSSAKEGSELNMHKHHEKRDDYEKKSAELDSSEDIYKDEKPSIAVEYKADEIQKLNETMTKIVDNNSSGSGNHMRRPGKNQVVVKRFKDLRQKIRHAIKESQDERHRITLDAVLHKIPHKYGFSKDLRQDNFDQCKEPLETKNRKEGSKLKDMRRTSSLSGSLDRYLQLYECSFQKEPKIHISEKSLPGKEEMVLSSRRAHKTLGRILSLPEMKSYSYKTKDSPDNFFPEKKIGEFATHGNLDQQEQENVEVLRASENQSKLVPFVESETIENMVDTKETKFAVTENQSEPTFALTSETNAERALNDEFDVGRHDEPEIGSEITCSGEEPPDGSLSLEPSFTFDEDLAEFSICQEDSELNLRHTLHNQADFWCDLQETGVHIHMISETETDTKKVEHSKVMRNVHVEAKDKAKFDYVRDVLELSGFSTPESLSMWHSDYQLVDPSVYEGATGCMVHDPECCGNEEGGKCNHLLLFDLINEVLMEIYERCYQYCPMPLSSLCHIHPMPVGYSILKEVWDKMSWYLRSSSNQDWKSVDYLMNRDLSKVDEWMNLQFESECVGLEVEDLIFDDLLEELVLD